MELELWTLWLIGAVALLIVEMITPGIFVFACFSIAAMVAAIAAGLGFGSTTCWWVFLVLSVVFVVAARPILAPLMNKNSKPSNVDEVVGNEALVIKAIAPQHAGKVKLKGEEWRAEASTEIPENTIVKILRVEGTRVIVEKKEG